MGKLLDSINSGFFKQMADLRLAKIEPKSQQPLQKFTFCKGHAVLRCTVKVASFAVHLAARDWNFHFVYSECIAGAFTTSGK